MASSIIEISVNWQDVKEGLRRTLVAGAFGEMWEEYCWQNNVPPDIKLGFLDYLANAPDKIFDDDSDRDF